MVEFIKNQVLITNESNMTNNENERNFLNISLKDYSRIVKNEKIKEVIIEKELYINNSYCKNGFIADRYTFLNMNISKGKTKKYIRVKFNGYTKEKLNEIKFKLFENERKVA
ncbi:hypothetical protein [Arcobacter arenosus]|uniref:hypothetical protein n=1 Tax=Arcobacter arenosus TaxID=2576037 RepID=UPI003BA92580